MPKDDENSPAVLEYQAMIPKRPARTWDWTLWLTFKQIVFAIGLAVFSFNIAFALSHPGNDTSAGTAMGAFLVGICIPLGPKR